jgi:hypothetical protein
MHIDLGIGLHRLLDRAQAAGSCPDRSCAFFLRVYKLYADVLDSASAIY